jgi:multiple sugar transport system permease protein
VSRDKQRSTVLTIIVWMLVAYFALPLVWLLIATTKDNSNLFNTFGLWFGKSFEFFSNFASVFTQDGGVFGLWLRNTAIYAVCGSVGATLLCTMSGFALAKYRFRGASAVFNTILGSIMVPMTALAIPTYLLFAKVGLTNTMLAVILPSLVSPFGVYLMRVYAADAVDNELMEAARIDGSGELRIFGQICFPLLGPGLVTVLLFQLVATWNNYFLPLIMLSNPNLFPVTVGLAAWQGAADAGGGSQILFSTILTGSLVSIIPLMIAFLFLQRYWQSGLATGSVKG